MTHFTSVTNAMFDEDVENHMGTIGAQFMSYERYAKTAHKGAFGSTFLVAGCAIKVSGLGGIANARPDLFGAELADFMKRAVKGSPASPRLRRGAAEDREPRRTREREGRVRHAARPHRPQLRRQ